MTPTELIAEVRELIEALHDGRWEHERIDYCAYEQLNGICDLLEQTQTENARLVREVTALAIESVSREKALARLETEVGAAVESYQSGKWEKRPAGHYRCSVCNQVEWETEVCKYCCNCGAMMEVEG